MVMKKVLFALIVLLLILHQDIWFWDNSSLVLGFLPIGLAYHAGYSIAAALLWSLCVKFAWPYDIETWADEPVGDGDS